jgi:hypothetical protein
MKNKRKNGNIALFAAFYSNPEPTGTKDDRSL